MPEGEQLGRNKNKHRKTTEEWFPTRRKEKKEHLDGIKEGKGVTMRWEVGKEKTRLDGESGKGAKRADFSTRKKAKAKQARPRPEKRGKSWGKKVWEKKNEIATNLSGTRLRVHRERILSAKRGTKKSRANTIRDKRKEGGTPEMGKTERVEKVG